PCSFSAKGTASMLSFLIEQVAPGERRQGFEFSTDGGPSKARLHPIERQSRCQCTRTKGKAVDQAPPFSSSKACWEPLIPSSCQIPIGLLALSSEYSNQNFAGPSRRVIPILVLPPQT